jgi:LmbE family N-acetylglucosaminyl deacetylase
MSHAPLSSIPRRLYRRARALRESREESAFRPLLRADPGAPELVLSPHLDDAVLDCWSLLQDGRELNVVNIFTGAPPSGGVTLWDAITGARDSAERVRERIAEDAVALARADRAPHNLAHLDSQYRAASEAPGLAVLDAGVADVAPSASRVYVPAGVGGHPDHLLARRYGRMLLRAGVPVTLYVDLPYCVLHGWPHWVDGRESDPNRNVDAFWMSFLGGFPEMPPLRSARVERLGDEVAEAKLAAMRCYGTQLPGLEYGARGLLFDPEIHRFEVRWDLTGPAR